MLKCKALNLMDVGRVEIVEREIHEPEADEVLIEAKACGICKGDINQYLGKLGLKDMSELFHDGEPVSYPLSLGHEGAGIVRATGKLVTHVKPGDNVTCLPAARGGRPDYGHFSQYFLTEGERVARIPDDVSEFQYWISEPAACAVNGAKFSRVAAGELVVLIGCGYMGLLHLSALPKGIAECIVAVDISDHKLELARKLGADVTLNGSREDVSARVQALAGRPADLVIEASGAKGTLDLATSLLRSGGRLNIFSWQMGHRECPTGMWHAKGIEISNSSPFASTSFVKDFEGAASMLRRGQIDQRPLITHSYPLEGAQAAFEAVSHPDDGYVKGALLF